MSLKRTNLSMPMTSAGIVGLSSDMELSGIKMDPRNFIIAVAILVTLIKIADYLVR
jgi:preprotein translocase subunit Sec61beta